MALTGTDRGTVAVSDSTGAAGTPWVIAVPQNFTAGAMAILCIATDNAQSGGVAFTSLTVTDSKGNTWTRRVSPLYDPAGTSAGVEGSIWTTPQDGGTLTTSDTITVTFSTAPTAKTAILHEVTASNGNVPVYKTGNVNTGAATGAPTVTTSSIPNTHLVIGCGHAENTDSWAGDGDTTNGTWSTHQHTGVGTTTSAISITSQRKVVSATATQTYNPTRTSSDCILSWIEIGESITVTPTTLALTLTSFAPTIGLGKIVTPPTLSLSLTTFVPVVQISRIVVPQTLALTISTFAPTVIFPIVATPGTLSLSLTTFEPTVTAGQGVTVTPPTVALSLTGLAPTVQTPQTITLAAASLALTTFSPAVQTPRTVTPGALALNLTTFAPGVSLPRTVTPSVVNLTVTAFPPTVSAPVVVVPSTLGLAITTFAPGIGGGVTAVPPTASLSLVTFAPTIHTPVTVTPGTRALSLTAFAPTVPQRVTPALVALSLTAYAPNVVFSTPVIVTPGTLSLVLTTYAPIIRRPHPYVVVTIGSGRASVTVEGEDRTKQLKGHARVISVPGNHRTRNL